MPELVWSRNCGSPRRNTHLSKKTPNSDVWISEFLWSLNCVFALAKRWFFEKKQYFTTSLSGPPRCICMYMYLYECICMYMYVYVCICMYMYLYVSIWMYMYVYVCICMYMYLYVSICIYMNVYVCICICICICICRCIPLKNRMEWEEIPCDPVLCGIVLVPSLQFRWFLALWNDHSVWDDRKMERQPKCQQYPQSLDWYRLRIHDNII